MVDTSTMAKMLLRTDVEDIDKILSILTEMEKEQVLNEVLRLYKGEQNND